MHEFFIWEGWAAISAVAQLLALATLIAAVWRFVIQRRQMPLFWLTWDLLGRADIGDEQFHIVRFHNVGRGSARLLTFGFLRARPELKDDFLAPSSMGPRDSFRLLISAPKVTEAVVFFSFVTSEDRRVVDFRWQPLAREGALYEQWTRDVEAWNSRSWIRRVRDRWQPRTLGPGGAPSVRVHVKRSREGDKKWRNAITLPDEFGKVFPALGGGVSPDLPYVPPRK